MDDRCPGFFSTRDGMKAAALAAMFLSHVSRLLPDDMLWLARSFVAIGYFTAPVMCWCLVDGFHRSRDRNRYLLRLMCCAVLSQAPYMLYFGPPYIGSMLCTLVICFGILQVRNGPFRGIVKIVAVIILVLCTGGCDWPYLAAMLVIWLDGAWRKDGNLQGPRTALAFLLFSITLFLFQMLGTDEEAGVGLVDAVASAAMALPACVWAVHVKDGHRDRVRRAVFYLFYPVHLLVLCVIRLFLL